MRSATLLLLLTALPLAASADDPTDLPTYVSTPEGFMHTEDHYLPGVTHAELGWKVGTPKSPCIQAQSIAARTYVLRWLNAYGHTKTIPALGPSFQAWTSKYSSASKTSSLSVKGQVMTWSGKVIYANYASGAYPLDSKGWPYAPSTYKYPTSYTWAGITKYYLDRKAKKISYSTWSSKVTSYNAWAWTYILNTDNEGKFGDDVIETIHVSSGTRNRGGFGQWRAYWFDTKKGYKYAKILRAFYGSDITIVGESGVAKPDLKITKLTVPSPSSAVWIGVGKVAHLEATLTNAGTLATSGPVSVSFAVGGTTVGTGTVTASLAPGASTTVSIDSGGWVPGTPGLYSVSATADPDGAIAESAEGNNSLSTSMRVHQAARVTASVLNVRSGPSTAYGKIGAVKKHQRYVVRAKSGSWYQLYYEGGKTGWVHGGYLTLLKVAGRLVHITASSLNVRTGPSTGYTKIGSTSSGQWYAAIGSSGGWYKLYWKGARGWVSATSSSYSVYLAP